MTTQVISYVQYQYLSGGLSGPSAPEEITTRNKKRYAKRAAANMVSFQFFDVTITNGVRSERQNVSMTYYIDGAVLDIDAIKKLPGDHRELFKHMRSKSLAAIMRCRTGIFVELDSLNYAIVNAT